MKDGIIIQARTGSTRLHNKILLPFYGEQRIIDILIENIRRACPDKQVILATTVRPQDDVLEQVARGAGIDCFRGDEDRRSLTLSMKNLPITLLMALPMGGLPSSLTWGCLLSSLRKKRCVAQPCLRRKNSISNTSRSIFILIPPTSTSDCCLCPKNWKDDSTCVSRWIQWTISCCFSVFMPSGSSRQTVACMHCSDWWRRIPNIARRCWRI